MTTTDEPTDHVPDDPDDWDAAEEAREAKARARCEALEPGRWHDVRMCCDLCREFYVAGRERCGPKAMSEAEALDAYADRVEAQRAEKARKEGAS